MPKKSSRKRKHEDSDTEILKKLRKIERRLLRGKRKKKPVVVSDSSDTASDSAQTTASSSSSSSQRHSSRQHREARDRDRRSAGSSRCESPDARRSSSPILNRPRPARPSRSPRSRGSASPATCSHSRANSARASACNDNVQDGKSLVEAQLHTQPDETVPVSVAIQEPQAGPSATAPDPEEIPTEVVEEILKLLGEDPTVEKIYGKDIQKDLAVRLEHITTNGLSPEVRKELKERYPVPANCPLIDAPGMNPEVKGIVSEIVSKRLKAIELKQKHTASAIACLGEVITTLLAQEDKDANIVKLLMDACRILCDSQYNDSITRRGFIMSGIKKDLRDQLRTKKIDSLLFGQNLTETVKVAKAINKSGVDLKISISRKPPTKKPDLDKASTSGTLNWKDPPSSRRPQRNWRKYPQKTPHANSSRTSRNSKKHNRK